MLVSIFNRHLKWVMLLASASIIATGNAEAQSSDHSAETGSESHGLTDIVVTARKQGAESLQRVPAAITAISTDTLDKAQITSIVDVGRLAPNVQLQTAASFPGFANFTIRGLSVNNSLRTLDPTVVVVADGIAFGDPYGTLVDTFDLGSVEILRGPQGVLLGRNATGGAVVLKSRLPADSFGVEASVRVGNGGRFDQSLIVEGPLNDRLRAKIAVLHRKSRGLSEDRNSGTIVPTPTGAAAQLYGNATGHEVRDDVLLIRPTIVWEPTDQVDISLIAEHVDATYGGNDARIIVPRGPLLSVLGYTPPPFSYEIDHDIIGRTKIVTDRATLEANWNVGVGTITSSTGWRKVNHDATIDIDATPFTLLHFPDNKNDSDQFSSELRFASSFSDRIKILAGAYYQHLTMTAVERRIRNTLIVSAAGPFTTQYQEGTYLQTSSNKSVFANVDWTMLDGLTLSGGARYTSERKAIAIALLRTCPGVGFDACLTDRQRRKGSWNDVSPRAAISWQANRDLLLYGSWTRGFRSGNFNGRATPAPAPADPGAGIGPSDPEKATSFEAGFKATFLDRRARLNVAVFVTKYDDIQKVLTSTQSTQTILNAASATIKGIEVEASLQPIDGLTFDGAFGLTDASYDRFDGLDLTGDRIPDPALAKQLSFERVPKYTATAAATYDFSIPVVPGDWSARVSYSYFSKIYTDLINTPQAVQPGYDLVDASLSYMPTEQLTIRAYGRNLSNTNYFDATQTPTWGIFGFGGSPRTYGVEATIRF
jgi:iron complex outermembrane receptor protein